MKEILKILLKLVLVFLLLTVLRLDAKGRLHTVTDPEQLKTAAGCLGLLGVVTCVTLTLEKLTFAQLDP